MKNVNVSFKFMICANKYTEFLVEENPQEIGEFSTDIWIIVIYFYLFKILKLDPLQLEKLKSTPKYQLKIH